MEEKARRKNVLVVAISWLCGLSKGMRSGDNKSPCVAPGGRPINHRVKRFSSVSDDSSSVCSSDSRQGKKSI